MKAPCQAAPGTLAIAATPLGNLQDISPRLQQTLAQAHTVFAEDTRRSRQLLTHLGLRRPLRSLHAHNEAQRSQQAMALLLAGHNIVYLSDAGTPAISDPGAYLVAAAHQAGVPVSPVVGPSALTAALSVAGFGAHPEVLFVGFLPQRGSRRQHAWQRLATYPGCVVLFEAPSRLRTTLQALAQAQPQRLACLCRELTKRYEQVRRDSLQALLSWTAADSVMKGEITLVLGPTAPPVAPPPDAAAAPRELTLSLDVAIVRCLQHGISLRDTAALMQALWSLPKRQIYQRCVQLAPTKS